MADLIVHLARLAQNTGRTELTAAQWTALRFFARANRFSRTPSAFSEFHATTRGTASQTVKSLVALGLLQRQLNSNDARSTLIEVTQAGHNMLRDDPLGDLRRVLAALPEEMQRTLSQALQRATGDLATLRQVPTFGTCVDCSHCKEGTDTAYCHCTDSMLGRAEMASFCIDFQPAVRPD
ncbi:MarR family winged helix-turn-helix transcriptional regulator [Roseinatronobacter alkalisoli]|uniref:MarR family winged helix-turn-helix transcriptional regulator n=1 Tax=Roseinatronobacter alkalisoli TaxID=3028235 RepID=A0ABT5T733_9RHOB|nr:MarR family winged helix-turn-helix transcriptional regulator [Roseinatronobacter sp. HJB301]MDD7970490.1 MarR family winged helix-turn-helix transcriptional regulator [Roseinatronobacter sp. HJB301]